MKQFLDSYARSIPTGKISLEQVHRHNAWSAEFRENLMDRWGLLPHLGEDREPPSINVVGTIEADGYRVERIWFYSRPDLVVTGNLYVPTRAPTPAPAMVYLCGHHVNQKAHYQQHARRFAQLGFYTLILDTLVHGELSGSHRGTHSEGRFNWISRDYSPATVEIFNAIRGVDLLTSIPEVDPNAIGITGHSGGGAISWFTAALDPRITALASSTGTGSWGPHIHYRTLDTHCDCYFPPLRAGETVEDIYALVAPRPALIVAPLLDHVYHPMAVRQSHAALAKIYQHLNRPHHLSLFTFDAPHTYTPASRKEIFRWMVQHVAQREESKIDDIDQQKHFPKELAVFTSPANYPPNNNARVDEWFHDQSITVPDLRKHLHQVCTPAGFTPPVETRWESIRQYLRRDLQIHELRVDNGSGWWLDACLTHLGATSENAKQVDLILRTPEEHGPFWQSDWAPATERSPSLLSHVRGTGNTAWHSSQNWHLRRATSLLGTSIAALQAWDVQCFISLAQALLPNAKPVIHAQGDLCIAALLGAYLWGEPSPHVKLYNPPTTFDQSSSPDAHNTVIEVPGILRWGDINQLVTEVGAEIIRDFT